MEAMHVLSFLCTLVKLLPKACFPPGNGLHLDISWKDALRQAIIKGNELYDDLFDHAGVDLNVDDAAEMAGEDCSILCIGQQKDLFGGGGCQAVTYQFSR